jgi:tetratricopeptide (TPR) repeat protein
MARLPRFLLLFYLLAPGSSLSAQAPAASDADRLLVRGVELQKVGDLIGAIDAYKSVLAIDPARVDALSNLGAAYVRLGQFDEGIARYNAALQVDPTNAAVRLNLALAYYKSARPSEAIQPLKMVIATDPSAKNAYLILADCYLQTGQSREAVAVLEPRASMFGDDLAFAYVLGTALLQTGDETRGQQFVDRIFRAGDSAEGQLLLATCSVSATSRKQRRPFDASWTSTSTTSKRT